LTEIFFTTIFIFLLFIGFAVIAFFVNREYTDITKNEYYTELQKIKEEKANLQKHIDKINKRGNNEV